MVVEYVEYTFLAVTRPLVRCVGQSQLHHTLGREGVNIQRSSHVGYINKSGLVVVPIV
jgi:hypothetical protein